MKLKFTITTLLCVLFLLSCRKPPVPKPPPPGDDKPTPVLGKITRDDNRFTTYTYDAGQKLIETNESTWMNSRHKYIYDASEKLVSIQSGNAARIDLLYTGDIVTRLNTVITHVTPERLELYAEISYAGGKISQLMDYSPDSPEQQAYLKITYEYSAGGDLQSLKGWVYNFETGDFEMSYRSDFWYDDKHNPAFTIARAFPWYFNLSDDLHAFSPSPHNIIKQVFYDRTNKVVQTDTFTYTYSASGYPITKRQNCHYANPSDPDDNYTIQYEYKTEG